MGMFGMIGGSLRAAGRRMLTPEEEAMAQQQPQPRPMPKSPMGAMGAMGGMSMPRPLIGGQMVRPQMQQPMQPQKPPSLWDGIAQDPLAFLLEGPGGVRDRQNAQAKAAAQQAEEQRMMAQANTLRQQGYGEDQIIAFENNAPEWSKNLSTMIGANAPRPSALNLGGGAVAQFDPMAQGDSRLTMLRNPTPPLEKPPWVGAVKGPNNQWDWDPNYIKGYRQMHPPGSGATAAAWEDVPSAEAEALGYPKGTILQRNKVTRQIEVKSRPSTQMTGQPSESERKYAFYTKNAKHGLDVVNSMETQQGFNRADGWTWATSWTNQDARKYDQGMSQFIDSWLRAMTGAAATPSEIDFYKQQWTPQLGDGPDVIKQKRDARNQAVVDMQAAAGRGIPQGASYAPTNGEPTASAPTFPDGTPITPETLQQLPPELRQIWERKLPAQQSDPTEDAFIDGLFQENGADAGPPEGSGLTQQEWDLMPPEDKALFQ